MATRTKHTQWLEILTNPVISEAIAYSIAPCPSGIKHVNRLSFTCKALRAPDGHHLNALVRAHRDPALYSSLSYQLTAQVTPFQTKPASRLEKYQVYNPEAQQYIGITDSGCLIYDNGVTRRAMASSDDYTFLGCALSRQAAPLDDVRDRVNYIAIGVSDKQKMEYIEVYRPEKHTANLNEPWLVINIQHSGGFKLKWCKIMEFQDCRFLVTLFANLEDNQDKLCFTTVDYKHEEDIVDIQDQVLDVFHVCLPSRGNNSVFCIFTEGDPETYDNQILTAKSLIMYHPIYMRDDSQDFILSPFTTSVTPLENHFTLLLIEHLFSPSIQILDVNSGELGVARPLPRMLSQPPESTRKIQGTHITVATHLPDDKGLLGCQIILSTGWEACSFLHRGLVLYPFQRFKLGLDRHVCNLVATSWKKSDGTQGFRFHFQDFEGTIYQGLPDAKDEVVVV